MTKINDKILYEAVKDGVKEELSRHLGQQALERGYAWIHDAIREGTKEAILESKKK